MNELLAITDAPWQVQQRSGALLLTTVINQKTIPLVLIPCADPSQGMILGRLLMEAPQMLSVLMALSANYHSFRALDTPRRLAAFSRCEFLYDEVREILARVDSQMDHGLTTEGMALEMEALASHAVCSTLEVLIPSFS